MRWIFSLVLVLALSVTAFGADKSCSGGSCGVSSTPTWTTSTCGNNICSTGCTQHARHTRCHGHRHCR